MDRINCGQDPIITICQRCNERKPCAFFTVYRHQGGIRVTDSERGGVYGGGGAFICDGCVELGLAKGRNVC